MKFTTLAILGMLGDGLRFSSETAYVILLFRYDAERAYALV